MNLMPWARCSRKSASGTRFHGADSRRFVWPCAVHQQGPAATAAPAKGDKGSSAAFERGAAALAQYKAREGHVKVS